MTQKADHPHQAAVHLMKSLRCCKQCYDVSQVDYAELGQLQFQKDVLSKQLSQMGNPEQDLEKVSGQIQDLQYLIEKVREQNEIAYQAGVNQINGIVQDRQLFQKQRHEGLHLQIVAERERYKSLSAEIENYMERIRYLHRINEQLVHRFCRF